MGKLGRVLLIGAAIRFLLPTMIPQIPANLASSVELVTPMTSFKSLGEAFYYLQENIDLYDGGLNHHPPLLVVILNSVDELFGGRGGGGNLSLMVFGLIWTVVDVMIAIRIVGINRWYNAYGSSRSGRREYCGFSDDLIASFYLFNPLMILTNLSRSTLVFTLWAITESLHHLVVRKNLARSMVALAVASYLSLNPAFLIVPVLALAHSISGDWQTVYVHGPCIFIVTCALLVMSSFTMTTSWQFLHSCYGVPIFFSKITPNIGLWWYIFTEMFEFFTPFYLGVFNIYSSIFVIPLTLRLFEHNNNHGATKQAPIGDSFLAVVCCYLWLSFTKAYPSVGDLAFGLSLLPIFRDTVIPHCRYIPLTGFSMLVCLVLSPIFYYCWIVLGNGNSNFFYSIGLSWGIVHGLVLTDIIWGQLTYDYILTHKVAPEKIPKLRLTQI